ncbi:probable E3 ubiquitin-protein ligase TRIML1 [Gadus chalcogrammus]|uniref:probable E3 ubiquitin-protein ligase TRIML1 n=1 Tax=Gadus chalcogrammus TaxID=1042646 RepID=UPI0024C35E8E|nr:probable E3 ubiquitin-protein ligase TRIML1 [Gadus chalcogrammus]
MASAKTSCTEDNLLCSICLDVFRNPVSTRCGHNFCRTCITKFWHKKQNYNCPTCNHLFQTRPYLQVNTLLSEMAAQCRTSVQVKVQPCVEPAEVPCDVCTGTQLKAVKSCLVCLISYCQTHLEPHQRVAGLKKHRLVEPMDRLEDRMCKKHNQLLELFCMNDQFCVCQICTETDHRFHHAIPLKVEYEVKMAKLGKMEAEVQQMVQERKQKIEEIKDTVKRSKADADREIADGVQVLAALMRCIEKCQDDLNKMVKERLKSTEKQAEGLIKELEQEIEDLTNRSSEVKQLSHTKDHLHFLQAFRSLKNPPPTRDWTTVEVRPPSYVGTLRRSLDQLEETLNMEMKKLCNDAELKRVQQYEVDVTLDPDTAGPSLILSKDGKQVHDGGVRKKLTDNPKRFTQCVCVLTRQSFSSGRFYFEVKVKDKTQWHVGVARESINRKGAIRATPETGFWTIKFSKDGLAFNDKLYVYVPMRAELQKVGVFVDYDEGLVSFYDVEARVHIYYVTGCSFSEPLYPFLSPCLHEEGTNSAPLILSPVNQTD